MEYAIWDAPSFDTRNCNIFRLANVSLPCEHRQHEAERSQRKLQTVSLAVYSSQASTVRSMQSEMLLLSHLNAAQDGESWNKAIRPKAVGAWNLHELSLSMKDLQHFVIFSSIVSSIGHQGESLLSK